MNRADRRREAKLQKSGKKSVSVVDQTIAGMIDPIVVLLNAQEFDRAEEALKEVLARSPDHAEGLHLYGLLLSQTNRAAEGIEHLQRATKLDPETALYWHNLATAYSRDHQDDLAIDAAKRATSLDPSYAEAQSLLTNLLFSKDLLAEGTDELAKLVELRSSDSKLWHHLGNNRAEQQRWDEAKAAYQRALALEPENVKLMRELATIYMNTWEYDAAQRLNRQADDLDGIKRN